MGKFPLPTLISIHTTLSNTIRYSGPVQTISQEKQEMYNYSTEPILILSCRTVQ